MLNNSISDTNKDDATKQILIQTTLILIKTDSDANKDDAYKKFWC